jgi:ABC-type Fe3+-siderophore transport system permease subunit
MKLNKISQWAGYAASFFSIAFFIFCSVTEKSGRLDLIGGWFLFLAACSGGICLIFAVVSFLKKRKNSN